MDKTGVIYILTNPSFPEYVKIGYADDIDKRLLQLNRSECIPFDFNKFDVSWLLNLYPHTLEQIAKNEKVKGCVRVAIADALNDGEIALSDSQRLQSILIKHFC